MNDLIVVTDEQRALISKTIAPDASPMELELFFYDNKRRGVHPLDRLIHFTKRNGRYVPITSIHFMRAKADEGGRAGQDLPAFIGKEMTSDYECAVTVFKTVNNERVPYIGVAKWKEYAPNVNEKEGFMWRKMPSHMLAKCAEANALRLAFPRELAGLHIEEEIHVMDELPKQTEPMPTESLKDRLKKQVEVDKPAATDTVQGDGLATHRPDDVVSGEAADPQKGQDAPAPPDELAITDSPAWPYMKKIAQTNNAQEATHAYNSTPDELRQDCFKTYQEALKKFGKAKK
jgi:hypothetical protein